MPVQNVDSPTEVQNETVKVKESKIGTWISVGIVGAVILATYLLLYGLYLVRV